MDESWLKTRRTLVASFQRKTGRKPSADELQELCLALHVRKSQARPDQFSLAYWRAIGDVVDVATRRTERQERERIAIEAHNELQRSPIGLIPTVDRYRTVQESETLERIGSFVPSCHKIDWFAIENAERS